VPRADVGTWALPRPGHRSTASSLRSTPILPGQLRVVRNALADSLLRQRDRALLLGLAGGFPARVCPRGGCALSRWQLVLNSARLTARGPGHAAHVHAATSMAPLQRAVNARVASLDPSPAAPLFRMPMTHRATREL
jgi:hypothetical protein